jgi:hypothetical protein
MKTLVRLVVCCGFFSACTSVTVRRPDTNLAIKHVCIQENPKVWVSDFLPVLKDGFTRHGIATTIYNWGDEARRLRVRSVLYGSAIMGPRALSFSCRTVA